MNSVTDVAPVRSKVSRRRLSSKLVVAGYLAAIVAAMIGWVSAFGWVTVWALGWLLA